MKTLYRWELTGEDAWWGKGICNGRAVIKLPFRYFFLEDGFTLDDVANETITITELDEYPPADKYPDLTEMIEAINSEPEASE